MAGEVLSLQFLRETIQDRSREDLIRDIHSLTKAENYVIRRTEEHPQGRAKTPQETLLFLCAANVYKTMVSVEGRPRWLYHPDRQRDVYDQTGLEMKPCELQEAVDAMNGYDNGEGTAAHALSEVSDVIYNLVQAVDQKFLYSLFDEYSDPEIINLLLKIADIKFTYRYLDDNGNFGTAPKKNIAYEEGLITEIFGVSSCDEILETHWSSLASLLHAIFSQVRTFAQQEYGDELTKEFIGYLDILPFRRSA